MVIHHDPDIAGFGNIWSASFEELRARQPHVPTLDEAFAACGSLFVNIEIKNEPNESGFDPDDRAANLVAQ